MSKITRSILSILQENAGDNDITTINGIEAVATQALFPQDGLALVDNDYQSRLVVGFTLHYLKDEIGMEVLPLWKMALLEKLVNNYDYINEIYSNLDKQIFSDYEVRNVENSGENEETKNTIGSVDVSKNVLSSDTGSNNRTYGEGVITHKESDETGTDDATTTKKGAETHKRGGTDYTIKEGTEYQENSGTDTTTDNGYNDNVSSKGSTTYNNGANITFDTPVDKLDSLRTGGAIAEVDVVDTKEIIDGRDLDVYGISGQRGSGWDYMEGQTYDYMSAAVEQDSTQENIENSNDQSVNHNQSATVHGLKVATVYGKTLNGAQDPRKDTTNYGSNDVTVYGKDGSSSDPREDVLDRDTTKHVEEDLSDSKTGTDNTATTNSHSMSDATVTSTSNTDATNGTHSDSTSDISYKINMEMILRSESYLTRLWNIFDDLFINFSY